MDFFDKMWNSGVLSPLPPQPLRVSEFRKHPHFESSFVLLTSQITSQALAHSSLLLEIAHHSILTPPHPTPDCPPVALSPAAPGRPQRSGTLGPRQSPAGR